MAFCQSFMTELCKHIGADTDVPAGDIGTGAREIGYMFDSTKRIRKWYEGVLTERTFYTRWFTCKNRSHRIRTSVSDRRTLKVNGDDIAGKTVVVSGAGNVATYAIEKAQQLGAKVVSM